MQIWMTVLGLQAAVFVLTVAAGVWLLRLPWKTSVLAAAMVMPAPLFRVSSGAAGFVYAGDIVAALMLLNLLLTRQAERPGPRPVGGGLAVLAFLALLVLPALSTFMGFLTAPEYRWMKPVYLGFARGLAYFVVFRFAIRFSSPDQRLDSMLALQCVGFWLIALCGLAQYALRIDLDLWNYVRGMNPTEYTGGYGGGFMGLYRGAIGAWGVGILGVAPVVFLGRRYGTLLMSVIVVTILGSILAVGSRQGVLIGLFALAVGLAKSVRSEVPGRQLRAFLRGAGGVAILGILAIGAWNAVSSAKFASYVSGRFAILLHLDELIEQIKTRDPDIPVAIDNVMSNFQVFLIGTGYGTERRALLSPLQLIYVDSEILYMWQLGGSVLLLAYIGLLVGLRMRLRRINQPADAPGRKTVAAALVTFYSGILLMYGHFFILTTASHEAPVAYWTWMLFGLATGLCSRRLQAGPAAVQPMPAFAPSDEIRLYAGAPQAI